jgi:hypothetical protein
MREAVGEGVGDCAGGGISGDYLRDVGAVDVGRGVAHCGVGCGISWWVYGLRDVVRFLIFVLSQLAWRCACYVAPRFLAIRISKWTYTDLEAVEVRNGHLGILLRVEFDLCLCPHSWHRK